MAVKVICFYLPQFHRVPENDRWWGEGFTEWTLVRQARPLFQGHHQPNCPHPEIGYYDLLDPQVRKRQAELARAHGVYGFCYYHYWFKGKKLLEKPVELMLEDGQPDLPFCLNWANEPWSRRWYGTASTVLQAQEYGDESDWRDHFAYLCRFFRHPNYIKVDGRPVFLIYRIGHSHVLGDMLRLWRREAVAAGLPGMHFVSVLGGSPDSCLVPNEVDAVCEFFPPYLWSLGVTGQGREGMLVQTTAEAWRAILQVDKVHPVQYRGTFHAWDNTPRRPQGGGILYVDTDPRAYEVFLDAQVRRVVEDGELPEPFLFLNAWNEWGEGAYLEPDERHGRGFLEAVRAAVERSAAAPARRGGGEHAAVSPARPPDHPANPLALPKPPEYFRAPRDDVVEFLRRQGVRARRVLELGCAGGVAGKRIREGVGAEFYTGVEPDVPAAREAARLLDQVLIADLGRGSLCDLGLVPGTYDLLVALDSLQKLMDPWGALADAVRLLRPGGMAVVSLPNAQHVAVLQELLSGHWRYQACGLLDANHLRFFTFDGARDLLHGAGLRLVYSEAVLHPALAAEKVPATGNVFRSGRLTISDLTRDELVRLHTLQYLMLARREG